MSDSSVDRFDFAAASADICDAVLRLRGEALAEELGRIVRMLFTSPRGVFVAPAGGAPAPLAEGGLRQPVQTEGIDHGYFELSGGAYNEDQRRDLEGLATLTATLLQVQSMAQRATRAYAQVEGQLAHQSQILDQI
ncbi:MAG: GGDEF domain-containing protein, partial [Telluria sp.]